MVFLCVKVFSVWDSTYPALKGSLPAFKSKPIFIETPLLRTLKGWLLIKGVNLYRGLSRLDEYQYSQSCCGSKAVFQNILKKVLPSLYTEAALAVWKYRRLEV